ncbi:unnamed protein product [Acanthoscelides obtectus]|nr:unnamed protein product [Acanthoscelides obtectus]CAK1645107.1 hypothetical protein AOBTE_LOCUS14023 [Acanthoscelides obtectus]
MSLSVSCVLLLFFVAANGTFLEVGMKNPYKSSKQLTSPPQVLKSTYEISNSVNTEQDPLDHILYFDDARGIKRGKKDAKVWDHWGKWSACSVSCGVGRMTRWRHCLSQSCELGEKEAQIKT